MIKPRFNILTIKQHVEGFSSTSLHQFPYEVYPKQIQQIIKATAESLNYPIDFIASSILYAVSVAIGNTHRIKIKEGFEQAGMIYLAIVGNAGTNKSHPLSFVLTPIEKYNSMYFEQYKEAMKGYKQAQKNGEDDTTKPVLKQLLISDTTPEALVQIHSYNKKSLGVYFDELSTWFANMQRYNKGSEEQFWLSSWSGKPVYINRVSKEPIQIQKPYLSLAGTIQPDVLHQVFKGDRGKSGFVDRILFAVAKDLKKEAWSESSINPMFIENWDTILSNLLSIEYDDFENGKPFEKVLELSPEAKKRLFDWQSALTDLSNNTDSNTLKSIYSKIELYCIRFALLLQMMFYACNEAKNNEIELRAVEGAIQLAEYFTANAIEVREMVGSCTPLDKLTDDKQELYKHLSQDFTTKEGIEIAESLGIPERTFKRFVKDKTLFKHNSRGNYTKLF